jgi:hypothetical protein
MMCAMRVHLSTLMIASALAGCAWDPPRDARVGTRLDGGFVPPDAAVPDRGVPDRGVDPECGPDVQILHGRNATEPDRWVIQTELVDGRGQWSLPCGGDSGNEQVFAMPSPAAGRWTFSTAGSGFDTVLGIYDTCTPDNRGPIACNDDVDGSQSSFLEVNLPGDAPVYVVVDAYSAGQTGPLVLDVTHHRPRRLGEACRVWDANVCEPGLVCWWGQGDPVCQPAPDRLFEGDRCAPDGRLGACPDGLLCVGAEAGARCQTITAACAPNIPVQDLNRHQRDPGTWFVTASLHDGTDMQSCLFGGNEARSTLVWRFEVPQSGSYHFRTARAQGAADDTVLEIARACEQPREPLACDDDGGENTFSAATVRLTANETVYVKVSAYAPGGLGNFELQVRQQ